MGYIQGKHVCGCQVVKRRNDYDDIGKVPKFVQAREDIKARIYPKNFGTRHGGRCIAGING